MVLNCRSNYSRNVISKQYKIFKEIAESSCRLNIHDEKAACNLTLLYLSFILHLGYGWMTNEKALFHTYRQFLNLQPSEHNMHIENMKECFLKVTKSLCHSSLTKPLLFMCIKRVGVCVCAWILHKFLLPKQSLLISNMFWVVSYITLENNFSPLRS